MGGFNQIRRRVCKGLISIERLNIAVAYFTYIMIAHFLQIYYFIRIACILWKNSKQILKTFALYNTDLSAFRELSEILLLIYCSFNSTFYIWRDERLKKTVMQFLARLFCRG
jgi:hypothetical protein